MLLVALRMGGQTVAGAGAEPKPVRLQDYLPRLGYTAVEFKYRDGDALVQARLGGRKRTLLLDTGWELTTLDTGTAQGLKTLRELGVTLLDTLSGKVTDPDVVIIPELTLGPAQFLNQPTRVMRLKADYVHLSFDGALGCDFQVRNHCLLDCGAGRLYVRNAKPSEAVARTLAESLRLSGLIEVPVRIDTDCYCPLLEAEANGQPVRFLVDTGSPWCILDDSQEARLRLTRLPQKTLPIGSHIRTRVQSRVIGVGEIGAHELNGAEVLTLRIGAREWNRLEVGVVNLAAWGLAQPDESGLRADGLLGVDLLVAAGALIDFSSHRLWLRPHRESAR